MYENDLLDYIRTSTIIPMNHRFYYNKAPNLLLIIKRQRHVRVLICFPRN